VFVSLFASRQLSFFARGGTGINRIFFFFFSLDLSVISYGKIPELRATRASLGDACIARRQRSFRVTSAFRSCFVPPGVVSYYVIHVFSIRTRVRATLSARYARTFETRRSFAPKVLHQATEYTRLQEKGRVNIAVDNAARESFSRKSPCHP